MNFLEAVGNTLKSTLWDQPKDIISNVAKGDFSGAIDSFTDTFGENNRNQSDILQSLGIRGWVGKHPQETAGAVVGTILGGMYAAPALAGTGAAGATGATGASTGAATTGAGLSYVPTASSVLGGSGATTGASSLGTIGFGTNAGTLGSTIGSGASSFSPAAGSAMAYTPTESAVLGGAGSGASSGLSMNQVGKLLQQAGKTFGQEQTQPQAPQVKLSSGIKARAPKRGQLAIQKSNPFMRNPFA